MFKVFSGYLSLTKYKISISVALSGFTGFFIYKPEFSKELFFTTFGIYFLAAAASALNQMQEIKTIYARYPSSPAYLGQWVKDVEKIYKKVKNRFKIE